VEKTSIENNFIINWNASHFGNFPQSPSSIAKFFDNSLIKFVVKGTNSIGNIVKNRGKVYEASFLKTYPINRENSKSNWAGNGSGLIISKQGHIVTNHHVINGAKSIEVEFKNDDGLKKYDAVVVNSDEETDLAILKINDDDFKEFDETPNYNFKSGLADSGEVIYAYGYPMALSAMGKEVKITDGIISSKTGINGDVKTYQISAPIQPGNSGGPLFDEKGNLIGINSSGLSKEIADNVGYSIKTNYILNLIDVLPEKIELPYSYTIGWISTQKQIKRLSKYTVLVKVN
ncbi:MAG: trypsin-like peptidase domain-containing protein, partial [Flavobacteriaceae bacterium]|nr:trypsin-like peptidase domain-containing protein [Flavobacteriaceae bacterium]